MSDERREYDDEDDEREPPRLRRRRLPPPPSALDDPAMRFVLPVHTSGLSIAAGYVGLVSVLCLPAPGCGFVLGFSLFDISNRIRNSTATGAIFAIAMGSSSPPFWHYAAC